MTAATSGPASFLGFFTLIEKIDRDPQRVNVSRLPESAASEPATTGGFILRMGLVVAAVLLVKDTAWVSLPALCLTILVTHLGLLIWETRYVSASLAFPALKPQRERS